MIQHVDRALRELLIREMKIESGAVDINFDQPTRDWSNRTNDRPTINIFLHDVRENTKLRNIQWEQQENHKNGPNKVVTQRTHIRLDLHYLITVWAKDTADEHRLLTHILMALFRFAHLPADLLPDGLREDQPLPVPLKIAQYDELRNPADVWSALENDLRTGIVCIVTLALNPFLPIEAPRVTTRKLRLGPASRPSLQKLDIDLKLEAAADKAEPKTKEQQQKRKPRALVVGEDRATLEQESNVFWTIGGTISSQESPEALTVTLVERGLKVPVQEGGRFTIGNLEPGEYSLEILGRAGKPSRHPIKVPAPDYKLEV